MDENNEDIAGRGEMGSETDGWTGGAAGEAIGSIYGGPIGAALGKYVGEKVGKTVGEYIDDEVEDEEGEHPKKKKGGGCGQGADGSGVGEYSASDGQCHQSPETPKYKLEI